MSQQQLFDIFQAYGPVESTYIPFRTPTIGFVNFLRVESAVKALQAMDGAILDNQHIRVDFCTVLVCGARNLTLSVKKSFTTTIYAARCPR